jgi:hypothetical protein
MGGKGVSSGVTAVDGALSTAVAPYYGGGAALASPSSALVASHGRKLQKICGKDGIDLLLKWCVDTFAVTVQWCGFVCE